MNTPATLRARSEDQAARLPPLLARAEQLAGAVLLGDHGRRRAGSGDDFWQYRPAQIGDSRRMIDTAAARWAIRSLCVNANGKSRKL